MEDKLIWIAVISFSGSLAGYFSLVGSRQAMTWRSRLSSMMDGTVCGFVVACIFSHNLTSIDNGLIILSGAVVTAFVGGAALDTLENMMRGSVPVQTYILIVEDSSVGAELAKCAIKPVAWEFRLSVISATSFEAARKDIDCAGVVIIAMESFESHIDNVVEFVYSVGVVTIVHSEDEKIRDRFAGLDNVEVVDPSTSWGYLRTVLRRALIKAMIDEE